jgi:uncharacterized protein (DUF1800 family)
MTRFPPCLITNVIRPDARPGLGEARSGRGKAIARRRPKTRRRKNAAPQQQESALQFQRLMELRGWWLKRMATGPRPFQEKMVLFWHGHFATSFEKVRNAYYMWRQNELFRRLATGNWQELLTFAGKDPAMLIWLDQAQSRKAARKREFRPRGHGTVFARRSAITPRPT